LKPGIRPLLPFSALSFLAALAGFSAFGVFTFFSGGRLGSTLMSSRGMRRGRPGPFLPVFSALGALGSFAIAGTYSCSVPCDCASVPL
jgi:hypothetical protein